MINTALTHKTHKTHKTMICPEDAAFIKMYAVLGSYYIDQIAEPCKNIEDQIGLFNAATKSGTLKIQLDFSDGCKHYSRLADEMDMLDELTDPNDDFGYKAKCVLLKEFLKLNFALLTMLEQLTSSMRAGEAWRKELDAVGLKKNANKWLKFWDTHLSGNTKIQALRAKCNG